MPRVREDFHELVELCFHQVRPDTGTDYPCTMRQLRDLRQLPAIRYPQPRSPYEACYTLVDFLRRGPIPGSKVDAALRRIGIALNLHDWGPDLIIKAFHDLDTAFFAANLAGRTAVNWFADSEFCAMGHPSSYGMTRGPSKWPGPQEIYLNAHRIFRRGSAGHFSKMWITMLHEMVHAFYGIICGPNNGVAHGPFFREVMFAIDRRWHECFSHHVVKAGDVWLDEID